MDHEIDPAPLLPNLVEGGGDRSVLADVAGNAKRRADRFRQRRHALAERVALVGEGELRAVFGEFLRDPPGDRMVVRDAHHDTAFTLHQMSLSRPHFLFPR